MPHEQAHTFGIRQPKYHLSSATRLEQPDLGLVCQSGPSRRQRTKMIEESFRDYLQSCRRVKKKIKKEQKNSEISNLGTLLLPLEQWARANKKNSMRPGKKVSEE